MRGIQERNALVEKWIGLPIWCVRRLQHIHAVQRLGDDDAKQIGMLGLIRAAELWDEAEGVKFSGYAAKAITNMILRAATEQSTTVHVPSCGRESPEAARARGIGGLPDEMPQKERADLAEEVAELLAKLRPAERQILEWRYLDGQRCNEIARTLGVTKQYVSQMCQQICRRLRKTVLGPP